MRPANWDPPKRSRKCRASFSTLVEVRVTAVFQTSWSFKIWTITWRFSHGWWSFSKARARSLYAFLPFSVISTVSLDPLNVIISFDCTRPEASSFSIWFLRLPFPHPVSRRSSLKVSLELNASENKMRIRVDDLKLESLSCVPRDFSALSISWRSLIGAASSSSLSWFPNSFNVANRAIFHPKEEDFLSPTTPHTNQMSTVAPQAIGSCWRPACNSDAITPNPTVNT